LRQINADCGRLTELCAVGEPRLRQAEPLQEQGMTHSTTERSFILAFRLLMAWTFLYAASHQIFNPKFSAAAFLSQTKTFHNIYAVFTAPAIDPVLTFLVSYGHLLIGLSLLFGLMVRVSAAFGVALLMIYWTAHMDWPFIENTNNFIIDYHIVYATLCVYLIVERAGHVWGLDAWAEKLPVFQQYSSLRPLVA
jgi:thiosulfate dehydrogenase (quinone) large subunit